MLAGGGFSCEKLSQEIIRNSLMEDHYCRNKLLVDEMMMIFV
jgi:hypothetical protein